MICIWDRHGIVRRADAARRGKRAYRVRWTLGLLLAFACLGPAAQAGEAADPGKGWRFAFRDFVIAAWLPPGATDAEYRLYRSAGFNLVMSPRYALPQASLDLAARHGLKVMVDTYTPNDKPWGGTAGAYTPHPSHHPATLPELKWLHERVGSHPALAGYLLGDDIGVVPPELVETTDFLREHAPHLFPWICQCHYAFDSLAKIGNPLADPQIYPTLYQKHLPPAHQRDAYCRTLEDFRRSCRALRLVSWPMFNVCGTDEYGKPGAVPAPFLRLQPYAAVAYGAQGIWYFTFGALYRKGEAGPESTPALDVVRAVNRRIAGWGPRLLGCDAVGVFHAPGFAGKGLSPGKDRLLRKMSDDTLAGVLVAKDESVYVVVVDRRVEGDAEKMGPREVALEFGPEVWKAWRVAGERTAELRPSSVALTLQPGEGELLRLQGPGLAARVRALERQNVRLQARAGKVGPGGLIAHLRFDETEGATARDSSGAGNHAVLAGGAKWAPGKIGGALDLRAPGDSATVLDAFLPTTDAITVACWVNPTYPETGYGPVLLIGPGGNDRIEFGFGPNHLYPVIADHMSHSTSRLYLDGMKALIPEGAWGHIAVAAGPEGATVYVNGVARQTTDYAGRFDFDVPMITLGCRQTENYTGLLDDVRVYNRCLSAEEITRLFGEGH